MAGVDRLMASYRSIPATSAVRLAKPTSNLFRARTKRDARGLDTSGLTGVLSVDPETRTADVAGMCTYEDLVAAPLSAQQRLLEARRHGPAFWHRRLDREA